MVLCRTLTVTESIYGTVRCLSSDYDSHWEYWWYSSVFVVRLWQSLRILIVHFGVCRQIPTVTENIDGTVWCLSSDYDTHWKYWWYSLVFVVRLWQSLRILMVQSGVCRQTMTLTENIDGTVWCLSSDYDSHWEYWWYSLVFVVRLWHSLKILMVQSGVCRQTMIVTENIDGTVWCLSSDYDTHWKYWWYSLVFVVRLWHSLKILMVQSDVCRQTMTLTENIDGTVWCLSSDYDSH